MTNAPKPSEMLNREALQALALSLDTILNGKKSVLEIDQSPLPRLNGFVLMVFPFGSADAKCHYVSNGASREDIIRLFKEQLKQLTAQEINDEEIRAAGPAS